MVNYTDEQLKDLLLGCQTMMSHTLVFGDLDYRTNLTVMHSKLEPITRYDGIHVKWVTTPYGEQWSLHRIDHLQRKGSGIYTNDINQMVIWMKRAMDDYCKPRMFPGITKEIHERLKVEKAKHNNTWYSITLETS